jgi:hypothetical protein
MQKGEKSHKNRPILGINEFLGLRGEEAFSSIVDAIPGGRFLGESTPGPDQ